MNTQEFKLRIAQKSDITAVMQIEHAVFEEQICESIDTFCERIEIFPQGFLVAETLENGIVGYICSELWDYRDELAASRFSLNHSMQNSHRQSGRELYISSLAVLPVFRGFNLGKMLFTEVINRVMIENDIDSVILLVNARWQTAAAMYAKQGFGEIALFKAFFTNSAPDSQNNHHSDGIVMRKKLL